MKKMLTFAAALLAAVAMNAQHVTPLDTLTTSIQMDSLRVMYATNAAGMLVELNALQASIEADAKMLKDAEKQLKEEASYAKSLAQYMKTSQSVLSALEKSYNAALKSLQQQHGAIDELLSDMHKLNTIEDNHKDSLEKDLHIQNRQVAECINNATNRLKAITAQNKNILDQQNALTIYEQEIKNKEAELKALQEKHKVNKDAIKNEIKAAKAAVKAQK